MQECSITFTVQHRACSTSLLSANGLDLPGLITALQVTLEYLYILKAPEIFTVPVNSSSARIYFCIRALYFEKMYFFHFLMFTFKKFDSILCSSVIASSNALFSRVKCICWLCFSAEFWRKGKLKNTSEMGIKVFLRKDITVKRRLSLQTF